MSLCEIEFKEKQGGLRKRKNRDKNRNGNKNGNKGRNKDGNKGGNKTPILISTLVFLCFVIPSRAAVALDMEFYAYNGFEPVTIAFKRLALVFAADDFTKLFAIVCIAGIFFAGTAFYARYVAGVRSGPFNWVWTILLGCAIYLGLFVPKGSLTVYDPVKNRFETIPGIPDAVVMTAGAMNKIERILVDVVDSTAPAGAGYKDGAGGLGFYAVQETFGKGTKNTYLVQNLDEYVKKCVSFELVRPGSLLKVEDLVNETTDFRNELAFAAHPSNYCLHYSDATPQGIAVTCKVAWEDPGFGLKAWFSNASNYDEDIKQAAAATTFDPWNAAELARFKLLATNTVDYIGIPGITPERLSQQGIIARQLFEFVKQGSPAIATSIEANKNISTSLYGVGMAANEWIPLIRAVLTALVVGMLPFIALFIPSPFFKRVLQLFLGLFIFLTAWGVTDAIAHGFALEYADKYFEIVRQSNLGLAAWLNFPDAATKTLSLMGFIRTFGAMLAAIISQTLTSFGGQALASLATQMTGTVQQHGSQAAQATLTPEGRGASLDKYATMEATNRVWDNSAKFNPKNFVQGKMNAMHAELGGNLGWNDPLDAFQTNLNSTRIRAGGIAGTASAASSMGYGVREASARSSRASTFSSIAEDEARSAESILHGSRTGFERRLAEARTTRVGAELTGIDAVGGMGRLRSATKKQTAWSLSHQNTLGRNERDAATRAKRLGTTEYAGDQSAFDWADKHGISDDERGSKVGRLKAQEAFYGAVTLIDVAKELNLSDDELIKKSAEVNAARRGGDALTMKKWQPEQIAAARAFENQHEILREDEKQQIAHNLGVSVETLQRMGYRMFNGALTEDMATNVNFQLWAAGKKQQVKAGQSVNIVFGPDYKLAYVDATSGIQTTEFDASTTKEGKNVRKGDNVDLGDWYRNQDVVEATNEKGHVIVHKDPKTGKGMAATLRKGADLREGDSIHRGDTLRDEDLTERTNWNGHVVEHRQRGKKEVVSSQTNRGLVEDVATPFGQMHRLKMVDGTAVWESLEGGRYRSDHVDSLAIDMGIYLTGSVSTATIRDAFGEDAAVGGAIFTKSAEEVLGTFDLGRKFISTPKTLLPAK